MIGRILGISSIIMGGFFAIILISSGVDNGEEVVTKIVITFMIIGIFFLVVSQIYIKRKQARQIEQKNILIAQENQRKEIVSMIDSGSIDPLDNCQILLKKEECAYLEYDATLKITQNKLLGSTEINGGVSKRVTKKVQIQRGKSESREIYGDVTTDYNGILTITNQRISFLNLHKGFEIPLSELTSVISDANNIVFQHANNMFTVKIVNADIVEHLIRKLIQQNQ